MFNFGKDKREKSRHSAVEECYLLLKSAYDLIECNHFYKKENKRGLKIFLLWRKYSL